MAVPSSDRTAKLFLTTCEQFVTIPNTGPNIPNKILTQVRTFLTSGAKEPIRCGLIPDWSTVAMLRHLVDMQCALLIGWLRCSQLDARLLTHCSHTEAPEVSVVQDTKKMTKTGKPDAYWESILRQYAQGKYRFTTGKRPGSRRWKAAIQRIDACPLTPVFNQRCREYDIFGKKIPCKCGYHKSAEQTVSSRNQQTRAEGSSSSGNQPVEQAQNPSNAGTEQTNPTTESSSATGTDPNAKTSSNAGRQSTQSTSSNQTTAGQITCALCSENINAEIFSEHLSDFHAEECCEQCGKKVKGAIGLLHHIEEGHNVPQQQSSRQPPPPPPPQQQPSPPPEKSPPLQQQPSPPHQPPPLPQQHSHLAQKHSLLPQQPPPPPAPPRQLPPPPPPATSPCIAHLRPPEVNWVSFLPKQFMRVIKPADREWIAQCLYEPTGQLRQHFSQNWFHPPNPPKPTAAPPDPMKYFRQRMFIWAPMRMWGIPLKCHQCNTKMHHSGIYTKVREVIDVDSRYYLIGGDYPRCSKCMIPVCPWSTEVFRQLDPSHRNKFPAVLTTQLALDRKCVTMLKPRTAGNSSSYVHKALEEVHSEEWARRVIEYLSDCELHKKRSALTQCEEAVYPQPPPFCPLPLAQWFETVHANEILGHLDEMKGVITSTYGRILKLDSTKKITKKLAGGIADTATWMTNVSNEYGQVLNCVLTTGEGAGLEDLCQGIVKRYRDAGEPEPDVIYVDRDCCSETGTPSVLVWFRPWKTKVRLDIFHFMRRFTTGLTTEHHPLYGTFCSKLSSCIYEWDKDDFCHLKEAKRSELKKKHAGHPPSDAQVLASISSGELARHCKRRTRGTEETRGMIQGLLKSMWELTDSTGLRLINPESMTHVWKVQQKHLKCIQDPPGVELYTKLSSRLQKGDKVLDVYRCGRGSSSLESFHRHQCTFIPGWRCNAMHTQMYMLEGGSRWNMNRAHEAVDVSGASHSRLYDVRLMSNINALSNRVLGRAFLPEFIPPGRPTDERIAVEYLLAQSDRGDLLGPQQHSELGVILPDLQIEVQEEECLDVTISNAADIVSDSPPDASQCEDDLSISPPHSPHSSCQVTTCDASTVTHSPDSPVRSVLTGESSSSGPNTYSQDSQCDARGVPGWEAVDNLAQYLVNLNRTITALSAAEIAEIMRLYSSLHTMDKTPSKYTLKSKKKTLLGPWRASRKRSGSAPGQQAAERLFMTHGQAAQKPDTNRISECVSLRLLKEYQQARNRPKDCKGKILPLPQSIVQTYCHIKQLLEDSRVIQDQTNLVLVTINNTTVSAWLHERQKRTDRESLLKGVELPRSVSVAEDSLPKARGIPSVPPAHGHVLMDFKEPDNREGEAVIRQRHSVRAGLSPSPSWSSCEQHGPPPAPSPAWSSYVQSRPPPAPSPAWSSCEQSRPPPAPSPAYAQSQPPPVPSPAWSSYVPSQPPPVPSPAWPSYALSQPPPVPSTTWSSYVPSQPPPVPSPVWPAYAQSQPPPVPSPLWPAYAQSQPPPVPSPAWSSSEQSRPSSAPSAASSSSEQSRPSSAPSAAWSSSEQIRPPPTPYSSWGSPLPTPQQYYPPASSHQYMMPPSLVSTPMATLSSHQSVIPKNRHRIWRQKKAAQEDQECVTRGQQPKKRQCRDNYHYQCKTCGQSKSKITGHTQFKGKWYCPASGQSITEWRAALNKP